MPDVGEGFGQWSLADDGASTMGVLGQHRVRVPCWDPDTIAKVCCSAAERGVRVGPHLEYRDLHGFGRRAIEMDAATLRDETLYQVGVPKAIAQANGTTVSFIKPHGALYHAARLKRPSAESVVWAATVLRTNSQIAIMAYWQRT